MALDFDSARLPDPNLREEHEAWRSTLRRFVDSEVMPYVDAWDEQGEVPLDLWAKAAAIGLLPLGYPEAYGGNSEGIDIWHRNIVAEELARTSLGGLQPSLLVHGIGLPPLVHFGSEDIKRAVIPPVLRGEKRISLAVTEPSGGSDVAAIRTRARREGDQFIVDGSKTFISGGMRADWFTTAVRTGGEGARGISVLLIPADAPGVSRTALARKMGWWCSDTATIHFDGVRVPAENLIGPENAGFLVAMINFNNERMAMAVGMEASARVCLEEAVEWARQRQTFGKRLADHQVIRHKIAQMKQRILATQAWIQVCSRQIHEGTAQPADIALLKVQASETLEFCAREAMQVLGGAGYLRGNRVERIYREVRVNAIGGGSEEIMRDLAARQYGF
ncbi:MAG: acyl-CoA dehydrogenase family protein [Gammaproteobacteria bacterium]